MSNNKDELLNVVQSAIKEVLSNDDLEIKPNSRLVQDLGLESIDFLDVSCEIENSLGREVDFKEVTEYVNKSANNQEAAKELSVQNVVDFLSTQAG